jgi:hypothetical protein
MKNRMSNFKDMLNRFINDPMIRFGYLSKMGLYDQMTDEDYVKKKYRIVMGQELNLDHPQTFSEKLQWLKLYDRRPEYTMLVDKYRVREYVEKRTDKKYLIPLIGVWNSPDEMDFTILPDKFVLKCNHNSGCGMCICKDKQKLDIDKVKKELKKGLSENYFLWDREWPYKDVARKIIAEQYMADESGMELKDYKFYCFQGRPLYCQVISDRSSKETIDFFDMEWNHQEFTGLAAPNQPFLNSSIKIMKPRRFEEMKSIAARLSKDIPFVRVDLYEINARVYFGEMTFYPAGGFGEFTPTKWNKIMADYLELPQQNY